MSPIALSSPSHAHPSLGGKAEMSRRLSPWVDLEHSLSEASVSAASAQPSGSAGTPSSPSDTTPALISTSSGKSDTPRRPSPWVDLAHSLSETSLPPTSRIPSGSANTPISSGPSPGLIPCPTSPTPDSQLSSSALREWDRLLLESSSQAKRHHLIHPATLSSFFPSSDTLALRHAASTGSLSAPKLAAERDKEGHIEYKLKLIDPSPDRFERLVTQMLWRLKQGRNEAIYEIGLADDGTVIGLTRAEMDASLHTLEQMAAEVGATVLILKEIVLCGAPLVSPGPSSISSSALSLSSDGGWMARRPDLDAMGQPRKGSKNLGGGGLGKMGKDYSGAKLPEKRLVFSEEDMADGNTPPMANEEADEEDVPPFHLDLDDLADTTPPPDPPVPRKRWKRPPKLPSAYRTPIHTPSPETLLLRQNRAKAKAAKSAERREARRLELYKGDGTNPRWADHLSSDPVGVGLASRPSTLRLSTPAESSGSSPADPFLAELLHIPLDNLSLSFADVRTVNLPSASPCSSIADESVDGEDEDEVGSLTEYASSPPPLTRSFSVEQDVQGTEVALALKGAERICVEALVVRKTAEGVAGVVEWCEDGDDVWGFGYGEDGEGEGEVDPDDGWGFEG